MVVSVFRMPMVVKQIKFSHFMWKCSLGHMCTANPDHLAYWHVLIWNCLLFVVWVHVTCKTHFYTKWNCYFMISWKKNDYWCTLIIFKWNGFKWGSSVRCSLLFCQQDFAPSVNPFLEASLNTGKQTEGRKKHLPLKKWHKSLPWVAHY